MCMIPGAGTDSKKGYPDHHVPGQLLRPCKCGLKKIARNHISKHNPGNSKQAQAHDYIFYLFCGTVNTLQNTFFLQSVHS